MARPDWVALLGAARTSRELGVVGMQNELLLVNAVLRASDASDPLAIHLEEGGQRALRALPSELRGIPSVKIPMHGYHVIGLEASRGFVRPADGAVAGGREPLESPVVDRLGTLIDEIARAPRGLVMVSWKGGMGKTTIAASIAVSLARRGRDVHLTTTDPAPNLGETLGSEVAGLKAGRVDPEAEHRADFDDTLARSRKGWGPTRSRSALKSCARPATQRPPSSWPSQRSSRERGESSS